MLGEPFRGIVLAAYEARLRRKIIDRTLLGAGSRRTLQAKDEHKCGQFISLSLNFRRTIIAGLSIPITRRSAFLYSCSRQDPPAPKATTTRPPPGPIT